MQVVLIKYKEVGRNQPRGVQTAKKLNTILKSILRKGWVNVWEDDLYTRVQSSVGFSFSLLKEYWEVKVSE